jgi:hypothetical protein
VGRAVTGNGNLHALVRSAFILEIDLRRVFQRTEIKDCPSDLIVLYTDGITEAGNETGQKLGREQLLEWVHPAPVDSPRALGENLLQQFELFRGEFRNDDETLLVLQREEESRLLMLGALATSYTFGRLLRSKKRTSQKPTA